MRSWFAVVITALVCLVTAPAFAADYDEGIEYRLVEPPMRALPGNGRIEVAEVFWYGCPHCYHLEPAIKEWLKTKPDNVDFVRVPAPLNPNWAVHSRAYYAAEALGVLDKTHDALFHDMHDENRRLFSDASLAEFYAEHGVDEAEFLKMARSFGIANKVRRANKLGRHWRLTGVPAIVINGRYVTGVAAAGGTRQLFELIDHLVARESSPTVVDAGAATAGEH